MARAMAGDRPLGCGRGKVTAGARIRYGRVRVRRR